MFVVERKKRLAKIPSATGKQGGDMVATGNLANQALALADFRDYAHRNFDIDMRAVQIGQSHFAMRRDQQISTERSAMPHHAVPLPPRKLFKTVNGDQVTFGQGGIPFTEAFGRPMRDGTASVQDVVRDAPPAPPYVTENRDH
jgi:hypothetical protein